MNVITIAVDPSRTRSAWAVITPLDEGGPETCWVRTGACPVPAGIEGVAEVQEAVACIVDLVRAYYTSHGGSLTRMDIVVEDQHVRFASAAMAVVEVRTLWVVLLYQKFGVYPEFIQPSTWRVTFDLNRKNIDKKAGARRVVGALPELLFAPRKKPLTEDECEAVLLGMYRRRNGHVR